MLSRTESQIQNRDWEMQIEPKTKEALLKMSPSGHTLLWKVTTPWRQKEGEREKKKKAINLR